MTRSTIALSIVAGLVASAIAAPAFAQLGAPIDEPTLREPARGTYRGFEVVTMPPPFDHSKLMLVDDEWVFVGSSNWDARSLRLNFEFNVECYDRDLAKRMTGLVKERIEEMAQDYDDPDEFVRYYMGNQEMLRGIETLVMEDKVVDWVVEQAQVSTKSNSFDEVMNPEPKPGNKS